jgi:pyocin large subunit-like protein
LLRSINQIQGCQIFLDKIYQNGENIKNMPLNYQVAKNVCARFQMAIEYTNLSKSKVLKKYPNWEFWFKNIPSGNPDQICQLNVTDKKGLPTPTDKATIVSRVHAFAVCA